MSAASEGWISTAAASAGWSVIASKHRKEGWTWAETPLTVAAPAELATASLVALPLTVAWPDVDPAAAAIDAPTPAALAWPALAPTPLLNASPAALAVLDPAALAAAAAVVLPIPLTVACPAADPTDA